MKLTQKAKLLTKFRLLLQPAALSYFLTTKYPYGFPDHLFQFFTTYCAIFHMAASVCLATTVVISCYLNPTSPKFCQLFLNFPKMWGYPTSPILRLTNFVIQC